MKKTFGLWQRGRRLYAPAIGPNPEATAWQRSRLGNQRGGHRAFVREERIGHGCHGKDICVGMTFVYYQEQEGGNEKRIGKDWCAGYGVDGVYADCFGNLFRGFVDKEPDRELWDGRKRKCDAIRSRGRNACTEDMLERARPDPQIP